MRNFSILLRLSCFVLLAIAVIACRGEPALTEPPPTLPSVTSPPAVATQTAIPTANSESPTREASSPTEIEAAGSTMPVYSGPLSPPCGVLLSALPRATTNAPIELNISDAARAELRLQVPSAAWPALQQLLDAPDTVGLVAFQAGRESEGIRLNADTPMPLASVAKIITLVAYAEAIAAGELNPLEQVSLAELDRYYLPNFDLGAHRRAVAELQANGRVISPEENPTVTLDDVAWMMIRHSSNAAADYLHLRLGQNRIEETAVTLGLNESPNSHSAPCTFLGQFLMMANHTRDSVGDQTALSNHTGGGATGMESYGREVALLADAYINREDFRRAERDWRSTTRRPAIETQRYFAGLMAPQGTARAYAALLSRLAQNGLSNADSSFYARRVLEWTNQFEANQELFSNVGYKNGSLPGVLTTTYYAYRWGDAAPVVVVLFYRDLPQQTYRRWRNDLPHDELARWLLADPAAIPALSSALNAAAAP